eukprot:1799890-Prymnesium_polylepis.1
MSVRLSVRVCVRARAQLPLDQHGAGALAAGARGDRLRADGAGRQRAARPLARLTAPVRQAPPPARRRRTAAAAAVAAAAGAAATGAGRGGGGGASDRRE